MRSMKHVKRGHRVRTNRNAAACKRNAYRRKMQAKRNWQSNTIFTGYRQPVLHAPEVAHCTVKEPKQRSPEELAERQRAREQKRLEKELAKQKASTSALPKPKKIKKEKKLAEPVVQKVVHTQATAKPKSNKVAAEGQKQKGAAKESKADSGAKQGKKDKKVVEEKKEKTPTVEGKSKKKKESTKPDMGQAEPKVEAPVTNNVVEEPFQQEHHAVNHAVPHELSPSHEDERQQAPESHLESTPINSAPDSEPVVETESEPFIPTESAVPHQTAEAAAPFVTDKSEHVIAPPSEPDACLEKESFIDSNPELAFSPESDPPIIPDSESESSAPRECAAPPEVVENETIFAAESQSVITPEIEPVGDSEFEPAIAPENGILTAPESGSVDSAEIESLAAVTESQPIAATECDERIEAVQSESPQAMEPETSAPDDSAECADTLKPDGEDKDTPAMLSYNTEDMTAVDQSEDAMESALESVVSFTNTDEKTHEEPVHHDEPAGKGKKHRKQKGRQSESEKPLEVEQPQENEKEPEEVATEVHMDASKKHKKRRNRKSESEHHLPSPDSINYVQAPKESDVKPEDKHENGGMAEVPVAAPPVDLASCAQNGSPQETNVHKETEVYTVGSVPEKNQVVVDKEVLTLDSNASPEQFAANMAQLAKEHPELLENSNLAALGEGVTGKMTVTTYTTKTSAVPEAPKATVTKRDPLVLAIEREKRAELIKQRRERVYKLLPRDVDFCTRMLEAHKDDFQAMADDPTNVYQETAKAIQRKIRIFRESPQFETYVKSKNTSPAVSPVPQ